MDPQKQEPNNSRMRRRSSMSNEKSSNILPSSMRPTICCKSNNMRWKKLIVGAILLTTLLALINPFPSEAKKFKKEKKVLKGLVKGLIINNLSTRKNFLPLPVPIPGKWQQILNAVIDSGLLNSEHKKISHKSGPAANAIGSSSVSNGNRLLMLGSALVSAVGNGAGSNSNKKQQQQLVPKKSFSLFSSSSDLETIKKYTRIAAAKYGKLVAGSQQVPKKGLVVSSSSSSGGGSKRFNFVRKLTETLTGSPKKRKSTASQASKAVAAASSLNSSQNDNHLVTLFNLVKLAQQLKELNAAKLLLNNISKKSSLINQIQSPRTLLTMSINNKKSFMNKMHYIHKLTSNLNYRHNPAIL